MITINDIKTSLQTEHMQLETDNEDTIVKMKDSGKKIWIGSNINMASSDEITEAILETLNALADNPEYEKDLKIIECEIKYPRVIPLMTTASGSVLSEMSECMTNTNICSSPRAVRKYTRAIRSLSMPIQDRVQIRNTSISKVIHGPIQNG